MSVPLDLSLINQLLNEQRTKGDLNNLTKPGFFFVLNPTNTPNDGQNSCHVINLVNYITNEHTAEYIRIFQIYINDNRNDNTIWYRQYSDVWTDWKRIVTATDFPNSMIKIDDQTTLSQWYGMFSYQDGASYKSYPLIPSAIIAQQTLTLDMTYYFQFVLPAKPEHITDDRPSPLGIGTYASNLHAAVNTLSDKVMSSRNSNTVITPLLTIDNLIYSARSSDSGLFTDNAKSMFIATNINQHSPASEVEWGQPVIMSLHCHEDVKNPFHGSSQ